MLPTEDLFVHVYVLIDDLVTACGARLLDRAWLVASSGLRSSLGDLLKRLPDRAQSAGLPDGAEPR
jgi:hypothetical protein